MSCINTQQMCLRTNLLIFSVVLLLVHSHVNEQWKNQSSEMKGNAGVQPHNKDVFCSKNDIINSRETQHGG